MRTVQGVLENAVKYVDNKLFDGFTGFSRIIRYLLDFCLRNVVK